MEYCINSWCNKKCFFFGFSKGNFSARPKNFIGLLFIKIYLKRLLVSGQSPECSDCILISTEKFKHRDEVADRIHKQKYD